MDKNCMELFAEPHITDFSHGLSVLRFTCQKKGIHVKLNYAKDEGISPEQSAELTRSVLQTCAQCNQLQDCTERQSDTCECIKNFSVPALISHGIQDSLLRFVCDEAGIFVNAHYPKGEKFTVEKMEEIRAEVLSPCSYCNQMRCPPDRTDSKWQELLFFPE